MNTPDLSSATTGAIRTGVNVAIAAAIAFVIQRVTGTAIDPTDPLIIVGAGAVVGIVYRASRVLADRYPVFGHILFGINQPPSYRSEHPD